MNNFFEGIIAFISERLAWGLALIIGLIVFIFLFFVKRSALKKILGLISSIIHTALSAVLDFLNHIVEAIKSASYFIYAIRLLLFEKPHKDITTHVLQASVFFLSIASYIATFSSMSIVVNQTIALFLTFSIQATIVAIGISIGAELEPFDIKHTDGKALWHKIKRPFAKERTDSETQYKLQKGWIKRALLVVVLTFCIVVSVGFSRVFILNQINSSAYKAKDNFIEAQNSYIEIWTDLNHGYNTYQAQDLAAVKGWKQEIEDNKASLLEQAGLLEEREGVVLFDETKLDGLIETMSIISLGNTEDGSYTEALYGLDVEGLIAVKAFLQGLEMQDGSEINIENQDSEQKDITATFNNLKALEDWLGQDDFYLNVSIRELENKIKENSSFINRSDKTQDVYSEAMEEMKTNVNGLRGKLPSISIYSGEGREPYSNEAQSEVNQSANLNELSAQLASSISPKEVSPSDLLDLMGPDDGLKHSNELAWVLALGIDLIILILCLMVGKSQSKIDKNIDEELVSQLVTPEAHPVDSKAILFSGLYVLLLLVIITINLFSPKSSQMNLVMGLGAVCIILFGEVLTCFVESYRAKKNGKEKTGSDADKVRWQLHDTLTQRMSQEVFDLMDGIKTTLGDDAEMWPVYKAYNPDNPQGNKASLEFSIMVAFLQKQKLIKIETDTMYFSDKFIGYLLLKVLKKEESTTSLMDDLKEIAEANKKKQGEKQEESNSETKENDKAE